MPWISATLHLQGFIHRLDCIEIRCVLLAHDALHHDMHLFYRKFCLGSYKAFDMYELPFAGGVEGYFVPPSDLAERLIKTAFLAEGRHLQREADDGLPEELGSDQLLLLLVHLKVAYCSSEFQCCQDSMLM